MTHAERDRLAAKKKAREKPIPAEAGRRGDF
jgi:hypothetical protein